MDNMPLCYRERQQKANPTQSPHLEDISEEKVQIQVVINAYLPVAALGFSYTHNVLFSDLYNTQ